jgi:hypothetical protein
MNIKESRTMTRPPVLFESKSKQFRRDHAKKESLAFSTILPSPSFRTLWTLTRESFIARNMVSPSPTAGMLQSKKATTTTTMRNINKFRRGRNNIRNGRIAAILILNKGMKYAIYTRRNAIRKVRGQVIRKRICE